jgi:hypothetical protein
MANGLVYRLDLRGKEWENLPLKGSSRLITLYDPSSPGWPEDGCTTSEMEVADRWVREHYAGWLELQTRAAQGSSAPGATVEEACEEYLEDLKAQLGDEHNTFINHCAVCRVHLIPRFGKVPLTSLRRKQVRSFLTKLHVRKHAGGRATLQPAALATKRNVRYVLVCVWKFAFVDESPPFGGIKLTERDSSARRRAAAESGEVDDLVGVKAYTNDEVLRLLVVAMRYDQEVMSRLNLIESYFANVTEGLALILGTGARVEEVTFIRWKHIHWEKGVIFIPAQKR